MDNLSVLTYQVSKYFWWCFWNASRLSKIGSPSDLFRFTSKHAKFKHDIIISCCTAASFRLLGSRGVKFRHGLILKQVYLSVWIGTPVFDFFLNFDAVIARLLSYFVWHKCNCVPRIRIPETNYQETRLSIIFDVCWIRCKIT